MVFEVLRSRTYGPSVPISSSSDTKLDLGSFSALVTLLGVILAARELIHMRQPAVCGVMKLRHGDKVGQLGHA